MRLSVTRRLIVPTSLHPKLDTFPLALIWQPFFNLVKIQVQLTLYTHMAYAAHRHPENHTKLNISHRTAQAL